MIRKLHKYRRHTFSFSRKDTSDLPLDIVIPLAPKDLSVFPYCLEGLRENLLHPVKAVYVIAPEDVTVRRACADLECQYVDERELLPEGPEHYESLLAHTRLKRGTWVFQQFLKLQAGQLLGLDHFLIYDSDTVMINPFKYEVDRRFVLEFSDGYRGELDVLHEKLLKGIRLQPFSFMCHAMLMETQLVQSMLLTLEKTIGMDWKAAILNSMDTEEDLCFSEYELYGNYTSDPALNPRKDRTFAYWFNEAVPRSQITDLEALKASHRHRYRTLSFHSYRT